METRRSGGHGNVLHPLLEVNAKGLVTVATMLLLFVTIIPKIVKLFIPQAHGNNSTLTFVFNLFIGCKYLTFVKMNWKIIHYLSIEFDGIITSFQIVLAT